MISEGSCDTEDWSDGLNFSILLFLLYFDQIKSKTLLQSPKLLKSPKNLFLVSVSLRKYLKLHSFFFFLPTYCIMNISFTQVKPREVFK